MKKIIVPLLLLLVTAAWLALTTRHYYGLNSLQNIAAYKDGVLSAKLPAQPEQAIIYATRTASVCIDTLEIPHIFGKDRNAAAYALGYINNMEDPIGAIRPDLGLTGFGNFENAG